MRGRERLPAGVTAPYDWALAQMRVPAAHTVTRGSKDVVIPHGYLTLNPETGQPLFYQGTDFTYPGDNVGLLAAFDDAYRAGWPHSPAPSPPWWRGGVCRSSFPLSHPSFPRKRESRPPPSPSPGASSRGGDLPWPTGTLQTRPSAASQHQMSGGLQRGLKGAVTGAAGRPVGFVLSSPGDVAGGRCRVGELQAHRQREAGAVGLAVVRPADGGAGTGLDVGVRVRGREQVHRPVGS